MTSQGDESRRTAGDLRNLRVDPENRFSSDCEQISCPTSSSIGSQGGTARSWQLESNRRILPYLASAVAVPLAHLLMPICGTSPIAIVRVAISIKLNLL